MTLPNCDPRMNRGEHIALEEATRWLLRAQQDMGPEERSQFQQWLRVSPDNAAAMDIVSRSWKIAGDVAHTPSLEADLLRVRRVSLLNSPAISLSLSLRVRTWARRGAQLTLAAAACIGVAWGVMSVNSVYTTGRGDPLAISLTDGTHVKLDAGSRLEVHFDPLRRRVRVDSGEAEFDVGKDPWRPFRLEAGEIQVKDIGTRFTVRRRGNHIRVVLLQGKVELYQTDGGALLARLEPGQQALIDRYSRVAVSPADMNTVLAWQDKRLLLKNTSLADALEEFHERTPVDITLTDPALGQLRVSGAYDMRDAAGFISAISTLYSLSWRKTAPQRFEIYQSAARGHPR